MHFQAKNTGINWPLEEKYYYIIVEKMLAVYFFLKCFTKDLPNLTIKIHKDNTEVVSILKNLSTPPNEFPNKKSELKNLYGNGVSLRTSVLS